MKNKHIVGWCDDCHRRTCPVCDNCDCDGYPCIHQKPKDYISGRDLGDEKEQKIGDEVV